MNQSIKEEFRENFVGGFDAVPEDSPYLPKIESFIQSKISQAIAAERKELREKVEGMKTYTGGSSVNEKDKRVNKQEVLSLLEEK